MAAQSADALFEEEVLKRRLVIEGDGRSDLIKISQLSRNYIAWVRNDNGGAGEAAAAAKGGKRTSSTKDGSLKDAALESRVQRMASRLQGDMVRSLESIRVIEETTEEYKKVQKDIKTVTEETEAFISANNYLMPNSKEQRKKRKQEGEMEVLQTLVDRQKAREELEKLKQMKIKELDQLKVQEVAFLKKIESISHKVKVFFDCTRNIAEDIDEEARERPERQGAEGGSSAEEVATGVADASEGTAGAVGAGPSSLSAITSTESFGIEKNASLEPISPVPGTSSGLNSAATEKMRLSSDSASSSWSKGPGPNTKSGSGKHDEVDRRADGRKVNTAPGKGEGQTHCRDSKGDKPKGPLAATATQPSVRDDHNGGPKRRPTRFATVNKGKFDRMKN